MDVLPVGNADVGLTIAQLMDLHTARTEGSPMRGRVNTQQEAVNTQNSKNRRRSQEQSGRFHQCSGPKATSRRREVSAEC